MNSPYDEVMHAYRNLCDVLCRNAREALAYTASNTVLFLLLQFTLDKEVKQEAGRILLDEHVELSLIQLATVVLRCDCAVRDEAVKLLRKELDRVTGEAESLRRWMP